MSIKLYLKPPKNKLEAHSRARVLKDYLNKKFKTNKWKSRVYENLGWHYCVNIGSISVYYSHDSQVFLALVNDDKNSAGTGLAMWGSSYQSADPVNTVNMALASAERVTLKLLDTINHNRKLLNQPIYKVLGIYRAPAGK